MERTTGEIVVHQRDEGRLPRRRPAGADERPDTRLLRTIGAALPADFEPISQLGVETALEAMSAATMLAIASDLDCFTAWCQAEGRPPLPAMPEDLVRYLRHLETMGALQGLLHRQR